LCFTTKSQEKSIPWEHPQEFRSIASSRSPQQCRAAFRRQRSLDSPAIRIHRPDSRSRKITAKVFARGRPNRHRSRRHARTRRNSRRLAKSFPAPRSGTLVICMSLANRWNPMPNKLTVLLVDDHALVRRGFRRILEDEPSFHVVGEAVTASKPFNSPSNSTPPSSSWIAPFRNQRHRSYPPHSRQISRHRHPHAQHAFRRHAHPPISRSRRPRLYPEKRDGSRPRRCHPENCRR